MKKALISFACGLLFAVGLGLSGMTLPSKVLGFLDLFGHWDPSLALVMGSALAVLGVVRALAPARPLLAESFPAPPTRLIDARLVVGASLFGIGWGMAGFCPGPGLVAIGAGSKAALIFVPAMALGMFAHQLFERWVPEPELPVGASAGCGEPARQDGCG